MEIRHLQYVVTLAETLHFGRAAERMHIAQSAFSTHIARLERQLGAQLFDRSANRVALTPAGEAFVPRARQILSEVADASLEARFVHTAGVRQLRVGLFCDCAGELTPLIVSAFRAAAPDVELTFRELSMVDQVDAIVANEVDVAFLRSPVNDGRLRLQELFAEPRYVGLPTDHELAANAQISLDELVPQAFAVASPNAPMGWREFWSCDDIRGEASRVATCVTNVPESLNAIAYQGAVDTFPGSATRFLNFPGVTFRRLVDGSYSIAALAVGARDRRPHVEAFCHVAEQLVTTSLSLVPDAVPVDMAPSGTPRAG